MHQFIAQNPDISKFYFEKTKNLILISSDSRSIISVNSEFAEWIGYTSLEFTRQNNPITWDDITVQDSDYEADLASAMRCKNGDITSYTVIKKCRKKSGNISTVKMHVMRYPYMGDFQFFIVDITPLDDVIQQAFNDHLDSQDTLRHHQEDIKQKLKTMHRDIKKNNPVRQYWEWCKENPKVSWVINLVIIYKIFGEEILRFLIETLR